MSQSLPFSVYTKCRPARLAYLVDSTSGDGADQIDACIRHSQELWGGRFHPIVLTDGKTIHDRHLALLKAYDPDLVKTFLAPDLDFLTYLESQISPASIFAAEDRGQYHTYKREVETMSLSPLARLSLDKENFEQVAKFRPTDLVNFQLHRNSDQLRESHPPRLEDSNIERFLALNFGYRTLIPDSFNGNRTNFVITDPQTFDEALTNLAAMRFRVFWNQLSFSGYEELGIKYDCLHQKFVLVVGDSVEDLAYYWNSIHFIEAGRRHYRRQLWIPSSFVTDREKLPGLKAFIQSISDPHNWNGVHRTDIKLVSFSLSQAELQGFREWLTFFDSSISPEMLNQPDHFATERSYWYTPTPPRSATLSRFNHMHDYASVDPPKELAGPIFNYEPIVYTDCYIEFNPRNEALEHGNSQFWAFPNKNLVSREILGRQPHSRITREGIPSTAVGVMETEIALRLLTNDEIIDDVITNFNPYLGTNDPRQALTYEVFDPSPSDQGGYMEAVIGLFGSLGIASNYLAKSHWRESFDLMSNQSAKKDANLTKILHNTLSSFTPEYLASEVGVDHLTNKVASHIKQFSVNQRSVGFETLFDRYKASYRAFYDKMDRHQFMPVLGQDDEKLRQYFKRHEVDPLVRKGVIVMGVENACPYCGYRNWYPVDLMASKQLCGGCQNSYYLHSEAPWRYRLNNLVLSSHKFGQTAVILTLGQLAQDYRSSFIHAASRDLKKRYTNETLTDLDIVCVQDGQWIIGEVKNSAELLNTPDLKKLADLAQQIRPDILVVAWLHGTIKTAIELELQKMQKTLATNSIDLQFYPILERHDATDPDYPFMHERD